MSGVRGAALLELSGLPSLAGLRHVSDDMKTHKNPALKNQGGPVRSGPKPFTAPKPACNANPSQGTSPKAPPLLELEGKKWRVVSACCWQEWVGGMGTFEEQRGLFWRPKRHQPEGTCLFLKGF